VIQDRDDPEAREVHLPRKDRKVLEACCRSPLTINAIEAGRIVLLAAPGAAPVDRKGSWPVRAAFYALYLFAGSDDQEPQ